MATNDPQTAVQLTTAEIEALRERDKFTIEAFPDGDIARLLATLDAIPRTPVEVQAVYDAHKAVIERLRRERDTYRAFIEQVAGDHPHVWDAVDPQEVWACEVCHEYSHEWAEDVQEQARTLRTGTEKG